MPCETNEHRSAVFLVDDVIDHRLGAVEIALLDVEGGDGADILDGAWSSKGVGVGTGRKEKTSDRDLHCCGDGWSYRI